MRPATIFQLIKPMMKRTWAIAAILLLLTPMGNAWGAGTPPSTFGNTIGQALLCVDQIDPFYFWSYMNQYFGPPYKKEGGAYWFKVQGSLWGAPISEVLVSDGANDQVFLAASFKNDPAKLVAAILDSTGISYPRQTSFQYSPFISGMGSKIVYFGQGAKIYCAKYNLDFMRR